MASEASVSSQWIYKSGVLKRYTLDIEVWESLEDKLIEVMEVGVMT